MADPSTNSPLISCSACRRHVRTSEGACPFCGEAITSADRARVPPGTNRQLSRAAAFVFGTTMAVACGSTVESGDGEDDDASAGPGGGDTMMDSSSFVAAYGGPGPGPGPGGLGGMGGFGGDGGDGGVGGEAMGGDPTGGAGGVGGDNTGGAGGEMGDQGGAVPLYGATPAP